MDAIEATVGTAIYLLILLVIMLFLLRLLIMALRWLCSIMSGRR